ncbi:MAG: hypothetical protein NTW86_23840 [Candidatus Sumerlaeota bacterium]|nr:hypothetical protein [Candidatus Sumerlaeota bacterium]
MATILEGLPNAFAWVVRASAQAGVMIALALTWALRERLAPRWRHALWLLVLARLALPWTPESRVSVFNWLPLDRPALSRPALSRLASVQLPDGADSIDEIDGVDEVDEMDGVDRVDQMVGAGQAEESGATGQSVHSVDSNQPVHAVHAVHDVHSIESSIPVQPGLWRAESSHRQDLLDRPSSGNA